MNKITVLNVPEMTSFSIECNCGEMIFSHAFEWDYSEKNHTSKGVYCCPHCMKHYRFETKKGIFTMVVSNVSNN